MWVNSTIGNIKHLVDFNGTTENVIQILLTIEQLQNAQRTVCVVSTNPLSVIAAQVAQIQV